MHQIAILPAHVYFWTWFHFDAKKYTINQERIILEDVVACWSVHLFSFSWCMYGLTLSWDFFWYSWARCSNSHTASFYKIPSQWNHYWQTAFYENVVDPLWLWVGMLMSSVNNSLVIRGWCSWIHVVSLIYLVSRGQPRVQSCHDECCICHMVTSLLLLSILWQLINLVEIQ